MAVTTPDTRTPTTEVVRRQIEGGRTDVSGLVFQGLLLLSLIVTLAILVLLLVEVIPGAITVFADRGVGFLTSPLSRAAARTGLSQSIQGSMIIGAFVVLLAFPIGIAAAVYLEEYAAKNTLTRIIDVNIRNLAGVPSIVYGLLGLAIFVQLLGGFTGGRSVMAGGLTLAVLVLPIVIITSAEAIRAVPDSIREAGFGVGATRWETIRSHVLPYAAPGILTGTILSLARALGEAAPLILVGAITGFLAIGGEPNFIETLQGPFLALPTTIFNFARQPGGDFRNELTPAAIVVLLVIVFLANFAAITLRNRYDRRR